MADPSTAAYYLSRSLREAVPSLSGSSEDVEMARLGLEKAKLGEQIRRGGLQDQLTQIDLLNKQREEERLNKPWSLRAGLDSFGKKVGFDPSQALTYKDYAVKNVVSKLHTAFPGDVSMRATGDDINFYRKMPDGTEQPITERERRQDPKVKTAISGIIVSTTSRKKFLEMMAKGTGPQTEKFRKLLKKYNSDPATGLAMELEGKRELRNYMQSKGIQPEALKVIDNEIKAVEKRYDRVFQTPQQKNLHEQKMANLKKQSKYYEAQTAKAGQPKGLSTLEVKKWGIAQEKSAILNQIINSRQVMEEDGFTLRPATPAEMEKASQELIPLAKEIVRYEEIDRQSRGRGTTQPTPSSTKQPSPPLPDTTGREIREAGKAPEKKPVTKLKPSDVGRVGKGKDGNLYVVARNEEFEPIVVPIPPDRPLADMTSEEHMKIIKEKAKQGWGALQEYFKKLKESKAIQMPGR